MAKTTETRRVSSSAIALRRQLGVFAGVTVILDGMIGSGIFIAPTEVVEYVKSYNAALLIWLCAGIFSWIGAYCITELGCMINRDGGDYEYVLITYGPFWAFIRLWVEIIISRPCYAAIVVNTFAIYVLKPVFTCVDPPDHVVRMISFVCLLTFGYVNCASVTYTVELQDLFTATKIICLVVIMLTGIYQLCTGHTEHLNFEGTSSDLHGWMFASYAAMYSYHNWNYLNILVEELKEPAKTLPRAISISVPFVIVTYTLTNLAFYSTLSKEEMLGSLAVAETYMHKLLGKKPSYFLAIAVSGATLGGACVKTLTTSRILFSAAMEGQMPHVLCMIHYRRKTPMVSVIAFIALTSCYLSFPYHAIKELIYFTSFSTWFGLGMTISCVPWLRWTRPELERPVKVNLIFPFLYLIGTFCVVAVPFYVSPRKTGIGFLLILSAVPFYLIFCKLLPGTKCINALSTCVDRFCQKLFLVVHPYHTD